MSGVKMSVAFRAPDGYIRLLIEDNETPSGQHVYVFHMTTEQAIAFGQELLDAAAETLQQLEDHNA